LELDRATEDNPRFAREKVRPGVAYLRSAAYKKRFGYQTGRWLVVTTTDRRMQNMNRQAELAVGGDARVFYFTTADRLAPGTLLTASIWTEAALTAHARCFKFDDRAAMLKQCRGEVSPGAVL
jgi:hypothetical protein